MNPLINLHNERKLKYNSFFFDFSFDFRLSNIKKKFSTYFEITKGITEGNNNESSYGTFNTSSETNNENMQEESSNSNQLNEMGEQNKRWEYYEILGVPRGATEDEMKQKRKKLALRFHPDKNNGKEEEAQVSN